ncbi:MAG: DUF4345 domain-containing protein [Cytophagales bacterium]|nr:MAG: DUF4345 domain-containing protein [Cytophagales bacterium]
MQVHTLVRSLSYGFITLSILALLWVTVQALYDPQSVMDLVKVSLNQNTDALSSIRGVYGGVGVTLISLLVYFLLKSPKSALAFLGMFWGMYAFSRLITFFAEGTLGNFATQWLYVESCFSIIHIALLMAEYKTDPQLKKQRQRA